MGPLWHPRQQHFARLHGHDVERGPRTGARSWRVGSAQPHWQDGGSRRVDRPGSSALQLRWKLYHGFGFGDRWRPNLFLTQLFPPGPLEERGDVESGYILESEMK